MPDADLVAFPLPTGRSGNTGFVTVLFAPRLRTEGVLNDWDDWKSWPSALSGAGPGAPDRDACPRGRQRRAERAALHPGRAQLARGVPDLHHGRALQLHRPVPEHLHLLPGRWAPGRRREPLHVGRGELSHLPAHRGPGRGPEHLPWREAQLPAAEASTSCRWATVRSKTCPRPSSTSGWASSVPPGAPASPRPRRGLQREPHRHPEPDARPGGDRLRHAPGSPGGALQDAHPSTFLALETRPAAAAGSRPVAAGRRPRVHLRAARPRRGHRPARPAHPQRRRRRTAGHPQRRHPPPP